MALTGGEILDSTRLSTDQEIEWYCIRVHSDDGPLDDLPHLRKLIGEPGRLLGDSDRILSLYALVLQYTLQGYHVTLNPMLIPGNRLESYEDGGRDFMQDQSWDLSASATARAVVGEDGTITSLTVLSGASGYKAPPTVRIEPPPTGGSGTALGRTMIEMGRVMSIEITNPGSGYDPKSPPLVTIGAPPPVCAEVSVGEDGTITTVTVLSSAGGYKRPPSVMIDPPPMGEPEGETESAEVQAEIENGRVIAIEIINPGSGYDPSSPPQITVAPPITLPSIAMRDELFGVRKMWSFMSMFDFDKNLVPVGFLDVGFAPNPDFRGFPNIDEMDVDTGIRGTGAASSAPEVGNGFFGDKTWHGNGVVSVAGAVHNNRFGTMGVGGQVVDPKLYKLGLESLAFGIGRAIRSAVDDGCALINISAGYPCRILWRFGPDNICNDRGRRIFLSKLGLLTAQLVYKACVRKGKFKRIRKVVCGVGAAVGFVAGSAIGNLLQLPLLTFSATGHTIGNTKGEMEDGVNYALQAGVPVIANAGNRLGSVPDVFRDVFDLEESDISEWGVIPASLPGVICVGAASGFDWAHYRNLHFHGDRVDIWAPQDHCFFAPTDG